MQTVRMALTPPSCELRQLCLLSFVLCLIPAIAARFVDLRLHLRQEELNVQHELTTQQLFPGSSSKTSIPISSSETSPGFSLGSLPNSLGLPQYQHTSPPEARSIDLSLALSYSSPSVSSASERSPPVEETVGKTRAGPHGESSSTVNENRPNGWHYQSHFQNPQSRAPWTMVNTFMKPSLEVIESEMDNGNNILNYVKPPNLVIVVRPWIKLQK